MEGQATQSLVLKPCLNMYVHVQYSIVQKNGNPLTKRKRKSAFRRNQETTKMHNVSRKPVNDLYDPPTGPVWCLFALWM